MAESRMALMLSSRTCKFLASYREMAKSSRAKAFTTRIPLRFSCIIVPSAPVSFCTLSQSGRRRRLTCMERKVSIGTHSIVTSANRQSSRKRITLMAPKVTSATSPRSSPNGMKLRTASMSTVMRDISWPVSASS